MSTASCTQVAAEDRAAFETQLSEAKQLRRRGDTEAAEAICRAILVKDPHHAGALDALSRLMDQYGFLGLAAAFSRQAITSEPENAKYHRNLGRVLLECGQPEDAARSFETALHLDCGELDAMVGLARACDALNRQDDCVRWLNSALELDRHSPKAHFYLAANLMKRARREEAIQCFRRAADAEPTFHAASSNIVFSLHYDPGVTRERLFEEACGWGRRVESSVENRYLSHGNDADFDRRIRIGYVSGDLRRHPVGFFFEGVLAAHNKSMVETFCYSNSRSKDSLTDRIRAASDNWRNITGMHDGAAAKLVRQDEIDVLVDLGGHTGSHRLTMFCLKPAPVQVSWLGYFDTTGLQAMDYLLADWRVCPPDHDQFYVEKVVRLPHDFLCYTPQAQIEPGQLPAYRNGKVTFGCFNNILKVNEEVVALWAAILHEIPTSELVLKSASLALPEVRERYEAMFEQQGIGAHRLILEGSSDYQDYLTRYNGVDIALDPFPYNGGTTTIDALWMGVPTITLAGDRFVSRMGVSHLTAVGLSGWIASSPSEYVRIAIERAQSIEDLARLRGELRERLRNSPLCDPARFTSALEDAYREMWRTWCQTVGRRAR